MTRKTCAGCVAAMQAANAEQRALCALPVLFGGTVGLVVALVILKAQATAAWPTWLQAVIPLAAALSIGGLVQCFMVPWVRVQVHQPMVLPPLQAGTTGKDARTLELSRRNSAEPETGDDQVQGRAWAPEALPALPGCAEQSNDDFWDVDDAEAGSGKDPGKRGGAQSVPVAAHGSYRAVPAEVMDPGVWEASAAPEAPAAAERVFMYLQVVQRAACMPDTAPMWFLLALMQILSACLKSYAHGANDTANAAGPFAAVQALYLHGLNDCASVGTPLWVLAFCGLGIVLVSSHQNLRRPHEYIGLALCGYKVMQTIGSDITDINFSRGFAIELGSTMSVVFASLVGMPVSSTHCQIGSIVAVGITEAGLSSVQWHVFRNIVVTWVVTIPVAALASGLLLLAFRSTVT
ncbi:hypothetical protein MMC29_000027 [Sticta canariensis]|nr:hypothetical protein [Sticta canariensis]